MLDLYIYIFNEGLPCLPFFWNVHCFFFGVGVHTHTYEASSVKGQGNCLTEMIVFKCLLVAFLYID